MNRLMLTSSNPACTQNGGECNEPRTLAYWDGFLLVWPWNEVLKSFQWQLATDPNLNPQYNFLQTGQAPNPFASGYAGYPGGTLTLTVNPDDPSGNAVVWAVATQPGSNCAGFTRCQGNLLAYSLAGPNASVPGMLAQLWPPSGQQLPPASFTVAPSAIPTAVNGKVYVPAYNLYNPNGGSYSLSGLAVYGFCPAGGCLPR